MDPQGGEQTCILFSRLNDTDDFSIDYQSFNFIQKKLGVCTIDRFADDKNTKLRRFNSKYYCPYSEGVNAFSHNWIDELNWLSPPINLIGNTLKHARRCYLKGILFIPLWESAYYYPMIHDGYRFREFVKDHLILKPYFYSRAPSSIFKGYVDFNCVALLIDFTST